MITYYSKASMNHYYLYYQLASIGMSSLIISKSCADHHYFESSGKSVMGRLHCLTRFKIIHFVSERAPYCQLIMRMFLNILHIICRGIVISLLASYLQYFSVALISLMIVINYIVSNIMIKTDGSKHFWTAFAGVLLPTCFISRDTVELEGRDKVRSLFKSYYKVNSLIFMFFVGIGGIITTNCLLTLTDYPEFKCKNLPFLSYDPSCPELAESPFKQPFASGLPAPHSWFFLLGNVGIFLLSFIHVLLVYIGEHCLNREYQPVPRI